MSDPRRSTTRALVGGTLLVLAGLGFWALFAYQNGREQHSYARGETPPAYVRLTAGHTYALDIPGGVSGEEALGLDPAKVRCTSQRPGQEPGTLTLAPESSDTKAVNQIASFTAAFTGRAHIECAGIGVVYVDNADDAAFDWSGVWLVLASAALVVGLPLTLSGLRRPAAPDEREQLDAPRSPTWA